MTLHRATATLLVLTLTAATPAAAASPPVVAEDIADWLAFYPTQATAAGLHDHDRRLESPEPDALAAWVASQRDYAERIASALAAPTLGREDRLDLELLAARVERELFDLVTRERPGRDPLWWTGIAADATVFLLVRDDLPAAERLDRAAARAALLPRLADQARRALGATPPDRIAPEIAALATGQARATAGFYRHGFPRVADGADPRLAGRLEAAGAAAAAALDGLAGFLDDLAARATGSSRLGPDLYAEGFRLTAGAERSVAATLAHAEAALAEKRREVAAYGRSVWPEVMAGEEPPADNLELIRRLFDRIAEDRATDTQEFLADYRTLIAAARGFVAEHDVVTVPEPLNVEVHTSPDYFAGAAVGGVYPAGPFAPPATPTLLFLPTPPPDATASARAAFFRDFNHHFNVMITPHEVIPGHTLQLAVAAREPRRVRALFPDGVFVEGWGTFSERLMLDLGWGGPLDRLAHLKKQLENIARTIVDIRVHTRGMERDEVLAFVRDEALQDEQFAANMWRRALTTSPQLTTYFLGYERVMGRYEAARQAAGEEFELRRFMDRAIRAAR